MIRIDLLTDIDSPSGYSNHARELVRSLAPICDLRIIDHKHDRMTVPIPKDLTAIVSHARSNERPADVRIQFETPEFYRPEPGCRNIGFVQWETTRIPDTDHNGDPRLNWVKQMNLMDEIWTSASQSIEAFKASGVTVPIHLVLGPIDTFLYTPQGADLPIKGLVVKDDCRIDKKDRPLTVGIVAQWTKRKNIEGSLIPLLARFKHDEIAIVIKTYLSDMRSQQQKQMIIDQLKNIRAAVNNPNAPSINLIAEQMSDADMSCLYRTFDVVLNTSRGEGFHMPTAYGMACGAVPITCGFSATGDYVNSDNGYVIPYTLAPVVGMKHNPWYRSNQWWAEVDQHAVAELVRAAMKAKGNDLQLKAQASIKTAREFLSTDAVSRRLQKLLEVAVPA